MKSGEGSGTSFTAGTKARAKLCLKAFGNKDDTSKTMKTTHADESGIEFDKHVSTGKGCSKIPDGTACKDASRARRARARAKESARAIEVCTCSSVSESHVLDEAILGALS